LNKPGNADQQARAGLKREGVYALVRWAVWVMSRADMPREVANLGRLRSAMPAPIRGREGYGWDSARAPRVRPEGWQLDLADAALRELVALPVYDRELLTRRGDRSHPVTEIAAKHGDRRSAGSIQRRRRDAADTLAARICEALGAPWGWRALMAARMMNTDATAEDALRAAWDGARLERKTRGNADK